MFPSANATTIVAIIAVVAIVGCGQVSAQHPSYAQALRSQHPELAHPTVVEVARIESMLPAELMRASHFYRNPKTAGALAQSSWFTDKEMPVLQREAEKIPREQVYKLFKNAGFLDQH